MNIYTVLVLVWLHFLADFIFQTDYIAINKSKSNWILAKHVTLYVLPFSWLGVSFVVLNWIGHFITDYISSRWTTKLYFAGKRHWFFVVIGLDQAIHMSTLFITYNLVN